MEIFSSNLDKLYSFAILSVGYVERNPEPSKRMFHLSCVAFGVAYKPQEEIGRIKKQHPLFFHASLPPIIYDNKTPKRHPHIIQRIAIGE
jgi:hypothetical protein